VQLDPRHEQAWLWLSGVLDDPYDIAFCLNSALKLNPQNVQAQRGLQWIQQRHTLNTPPTTPSRVREISIQPRAAGGQPQEEQAEASWWEEWRTSVRTQSLLQRIMMAGLIVLISVTALLYSAALKWSPPVRANEPSIPTAAPESGIVQQTLLTAPEVGHATILRYLSDVQRVRDTLSQAVEAYRTTSEQSQLATDQIAAARAYRDVLRQAHDVMGQIAPPSVLKDIHDHYRQGLDLERMAFDDILEYYTNYNLAIANRAALRLQEAGSHYDQARTGWQIYHDQLSIRSHGDSFNLR
jgi:hypothetical protein